jgi:signal transduction histidine kinase
MSTCRAEMACASRPGAHLESVAHLSRLAAIGELGASILHQVNGPLTYVLFNLDQLERTASGAESLEALRAVREGVESIRNLSRDATLLARGAERRPDAVDLAQVVRSAARLTAARVGLVATVVVEVGPAPSVRGDATWLLQVLVNALLNAADACEASGGSARTIRVTLGTDTRGDALVSIADNGAGVSPEHVGRVFEPFFTTKEPGRGTGLGLSLAKRIVEQAGGRITFESTQGVGSVVSVVLPAIRDDE